MDRWIVLSALFAAGCVPSAGPCDQTAALELVYTADGTPAFAGQAIMQTSCGNGGFCHSGPEIEAPDRFGAPVDLGYDVRVASTSTAPQEGEAQRLRDHISRSLNMRGQILQQVQSGRMPPGGDAGESYRCQITPSACGDEGEDLVFERFEADGITATPLPTLLDPDPMLRADAQDILRNWLACGTPAVERTQDRDDRVIDPAALFTVPACERTCVDLRWPDIYTRIIAPTCASSRCHDSSDPAAGLDLFEGGAAGVHSRVVATARPAEGAQCMATGTLTVDPMNPDGSLLLQKLEATSSDDVCGSRMPLSGNPLSPQRICALRAWIECGACAEEDGGACAACLDMARADCNVDPMTASGCAMSEPCANAFTL